MRGGEVVRFLVVALAAIAAVMMLSIPVAIIGLLINDEAESAFYDFLSG